MRIVTDSEGDTWICLELPDTGPAPGATVTVECNSGADRVALVVGRDWDTMPEAELATRIRAAIRR